MKNNYDVPESKIMDTDLGPVEYAIVGSGKPILAFHGGGGGYDMSVLIYQMFTDAGFSLICLSRPGYLRTPLSSGRTFSEMVDLAAVLLDKLGIKEVGVVGASAGGPPTYEFAIRHPEKAKAIVVIDGISRNYKYKPVGKVAEKLFLSDPGQKFQLWLIKMLPKQVTKEILALEGDLTPDELKERVQHIVDDPVKLDYIMKFYSSMYPYSERKEGTWNDVEQGNALDKLDVGKITCPALIMHGTRDSDVSIGDSEYAAENISDSELYLIEGGTHFGFWVSDHAKEAQEKAIGFFREHL